jgi:hypothetical protein
VNIDDNASMIGITLSMLCMLKRWQDSPAANHSLCPTPAKGSELGDDWFAMDLPLPAYLGLLGHHCVDVKIAAAAAGQRHAGAVLPSARSSCTADSDIAAQLPKVSLLWGTPQTAVYSCKPPPKEL